MKLMRIVIAIFWLCSTVLLLGRGFAEDIPLEQKLDILDLRDMDIKDAIKFIAQRSGLNIVAGDSLQGRVTIYLEKVDAHKALATILETNRLAYEEQGGVMRIVTAEEYQNRYGRPFSQKTQTKLIRLKGMKATSAAVLLEKIKDPFGKVVADDVSGTILIEETPQRLTQMEQYLEAVDQPTVARVFGLRFADAEAVAVRVGQILTPLMGSVREDRQSNKIFVTDTNEKISEVERLLREIDVPRTPSVVALSYARAEDVAAIIKSFLTPGIGALEVDKRSNQIVITDAPFRLWELESMARQLDRRDKEVLIEARIVQVVLKDEFRMGIDWEAIMNQAHGLKLSSVWGGVGTGGKGSLAVGTLSDDNYHAVIEALGSANKSHILSNPRIAVINNQEAKILVGTTKPYVTTTTTTPSTGPTTTAEEVKFIDVGVKLVVTPTIHDDGYVTMKIRPEVSSAATSLKTGQNNFIPIVDTSEVQTTVRVKDGVTIIIGGLIKDEKILGDSRVPVLGAIPVVGGAFRSQSRGKEKSEIVIFLTPRIITGDLGMREELDFHSAEKSPVLY
ncbi:MAG: hypothetical protein HQL21_07355 [Candidatus Omnitrophica bacterium]|nr:hypothetical protein [Candidatus Omnitrophota bacterium]